MMRVGLFQCAFADDLAIFASKKEELQTNLNVWCEELKKLNLKVNVGKSKVMAIARKDTKIDVTIDNEVLEQVSNFKYLGAVINNTGKNSRDKQQN